MKSFFWRIGVLALVAATVARAQLVAPPTFTYISLPSSATVNSTVTVAAGGQANSSDNSDGNDWNTPDMLVVARIMIYVMPPGSGSWTTLHDWLDPWQSPADASVSVTLNQTGTWYFAFQLMDGRPWYSDEPVYALTVNPPPTPQITSGLSVSANQGQGVSYQIAATSSPTSYGASGLPAGLSLNTSNGLVTGVVSGTGTINSTISATNAQGTGSATLTWHVTAASIVPAASISPGTIYLSQSVTLTRAGTCNFGVGWTEGTIWCPDGSVIALGHQALGSQSFTPAAGTGTYWWQFRLADPYGNFQDQWISFTVTSPNVAAPTSVSLSQNGSDYLILSWSGASAQAGIGHYNVFRNGVFIGTTSIASGTDSGLSASTAYVYTIQTVDTQGNISPLSASFSVTTLGDLELFTPLL
ncbi:MAG TPA: putative Ig domain-containing protein [Opitutaceae bacterium]|nr:putative Ig domain-containing protein [Opitutaceae bacterium]